MEDSDKLLADKLAYVIQAYKPEIRFFQTLVESMGLSEYTAPATLSLLRRGMVKKPDRWLEIVSTITGVPAKFIQDNSVGEFGIVSEVFDPVHWADKYGIYPTQKSYPVSVRIYRDEKTGESWVTEMRIDNERLSSRQYKLTEERQWRTQD